MIDPTITKNINNEKLPLDTLKENANNMYRKAQRFVVPIVEN